MSVSMLHGLLPIILTRHTPVDTGIPFGVQQSQIGTHVQQGAVTLVYGAAAESSPIGSTLTAGRVGGRVHYGLACLSRKHPGAR
jgi:hypothetical protein